MKNFTKIIIPFKTSESYHNKTLDIKVKYVKESKGESVEKSKDKWLPYEINNQYLLENVGKKISIEDNPTRIGRSYILNNEIKHRLGFPKRGEVTFYPRGDKEGIQVEFTQVCMHFFETHVGFCEIEYNVISDKVGDYINANYFLSELKSSKSKIVYKEKTVDGEEEISISLMDIVTNIFEGLNDINGFERQGKMSFVEKKPLIYGYCLVEDKETMLNNIDIAKYNYKATYKVSAKEENYSFFDNSVIGASDLGVINFSCLTQDEETNAFFETTYVNNFKNQYYYLYLLLLNEKYTLTKQLTQYSDISTKKNISDKKSCESALSDLNVMLNKSILTKVRCDDTVVSFTPQIEGYFKYLKEVFDIDNLIKLVDQSNRQITDMANVYMNYLNSIKEKEFKEKEKQMEYKKMYKEVFAYTITNIVGSVTIFATVTKGLNEIKPGALTTGLVAIPIVLCSAFFVALGIDIVLKLRKIRLTKQKDKG